MHTKPGEVWQQMDQLIPKAGQPGDVRLRFHFNCPQDIISELCCSLGTSGVDGRRNRVCLLAGHSAVPYEGQQMSRMPAIIAPTLILLHYSLLIIHVVVGASQAWHCCFKFCRLCLLLSSLLLLVLEACRWPCTSKFAVSLFCFVFL